MIADGTLHKYIVPKVTTSHNILYVNYGLFGDTYDIRWPVTFYSMEELQRQYPSRDNGTEEDDRG